MNQRKQGTIVALAGLGLLLSAASARGQSYTTTVNAGTITPAWAAAVNLATDKVYVANSASSNAGSITVIHGVDNSFVNFADPNATNPIAVAVNPLTNKIYVANSQSNNVTVIDGSTDTVKTTVTVGTTPSALAVNPQTNTIYVANSGNNTVTVINGSTDTASATVSVGTTPIALAVNPATNLIYVANSGSTGTNNVTVINGTSNATVSVSDSNGNGPIAVAVNTATNTAYVANSESGFVTLINGATLATLTTSDVNLAEYTQTNLAVNPATNQIYVTCEYDDAIYIINGATNTTSLIQPDSSNFWTAIAVDTVNNTIYAIDGGSVTVISGATKQIIATLSDPNASSPNAIAINPVTDKIYVPNAASSNVSVFDGATNATRSVDDTGASNSAAEAGNPVTDTLYVANSASNNVTVINGATDGIITDVTVGTDPLAVAVNPVTNMIYVANNGSNNVSVINGATNTVIATVADPNATAPDALAINLETNTIYVANYGSNNVTVINGSTNTFTDIADPTATGPYAVAVNEVKNRVYVVNYTSGTVSAFAGDTNTLIATVGVGTYPTALAVNHSTNTAYVTNNGSNNVSVIDGTTGAVTTVTDPNALGPIAVVVNPDTNMIYVANNGSSQDSDFESTVTVINGANNTVTSIEDPDGSFPIAVDLNRASNKIYVANTGLSYCCILVLDSDVPTVPITVIDGATNALTYAPIPDNTVVPTAVLVNPAAGNIYVSATAADYGSTTVIAEQQVATIPITTTVTPLANDQTASLTPTFNFTTANTLTAAPIDNLLFQMNTWQGAWPVGTSLGAGSFTGTTSTLNPGYHILYAYSTEGEEATSTNTGLGISPLIGNITAYPFMVAAPEAGLAPGSLTFGNVTAPIPVNTTTSDQTVTLTNNGYVPLSITAVGLAGADPADYAESDNCVASSPLATAGTCTINVTFTPAALGALDATLQVTDNSGDVAGTVHKIDLTGTAGQAASITAVTSSANPSVFGESITFTATVTPNSPLAPTGTVTFSDGGTVICNVVPVASAQATCTLAAPASGTHSITAVYSGDSNFLTSTSSPALSQLVNSAATTTAITSSTPGTSVVGQPVTVTFTVAVNSPGSGTIPPTETVTISDGSGDSCTATLAAGTCTLTLTSAGSKTLTATYSGDTDFAAGSGTRVQTVTAAATTTTITSTAPGAPSLGQAVTVSYSVAVNAPGAGTIPTTDTVTVSDSTGASCTATLSAGSCALTPKAVGADTFNASFNGDANFAKSSATASTSIPVSQTNISLTGLTATSTPDQNTSVGFSLSSAATALLSGTLTMTFTSNAAGTPTGYMDPMTCFINASNQCVTTLNFTVAAGTTVASLPNNGTVQQGTTAGTITVTLTALTAGGTNVLPSTPLSLSVVVAPLAPVIQSVSIINVSSTGFSVQVLAYSTPRALTNANFTFTAASGDSLSGSAPPAVDLSSVAQAYFASTTGVGSGGTFILTVPFTYSGNTSALGSVAATLSNSVGTSSSVSGGVQ